MSQRRQLWDYIREHPGTTSAGAATVGGFEWRKILTTLYQAGVVTRERVDNPRKELTQLAVNKIWSYQVIDPTTSSKVRLWLAEPDTRKAVPRSRKGMM